MGELLGRGSVVAALAELLDGAAGGAGGAIWLEGEAGIGKSRLLAAARELAARRFLVLTTTGYESEVDLAWGGLLSLVEPLRGDGADGLPEPQRRALDIALRRTDIEEPVEAFAVVLAVRHLLLDESSRRPILLLVDDAHWLDESTRLLVDHVSRRAGDLALAVVAAGRPSALPTPVPPTELGPLDDRAADALLVDAGVDSTAVRRRLVDELGGRPMLLLATAARLDAEGREPAVAGTPVALPSTLLGLAADRLRALPPSSAFPLLVAATLAGGDQDTVGRALRAEGGQLDDLDAAEAAGIVAFDAGRIVFTHPTLRSAAYHGAAASDRRRAHRAVGQAVAGPELRALHLGLGAEGPDPALAELVASAAEVLSGRGAPVEAARAHEIAARLTGDPLVAARRLRQAAELLVDTPEATAALDLLDRADLTDRPLLERARAERVRLRLAARQGQDDLTLDRLQALAASVAEEDPGLAASILLEALPGLIRRQRVVDVAAVAIQARELADASAEVAIRRRAAVAVGGALVAMGDPDGGPLLEQYTVLLAEEGAARAGPFLAEVAAPVLGFLQRSDEAWQLLADLEAELRVRAALPVLATVLAAKALITHGPDLSATVAAAEEAVGLAEELRHPGLVAMPASSLAVAAAMRGDAVRTERGVRLLEADGSVVSRVAAEVAMAALALGEGRLDDALAIYGPLAAWAGMGTGVLRWEPEYAETLVRAQRRDEARQVLTDLAAAGGPSWALAGVARVEGMLAADEESAEPHLQTSVDLMAAVGNDVGQGRTELVWGERLRRARRRAAARPHLERAVELLTRSGAAVWAERAAAELALAGGVAPDRGPGGVEGLTPQELQVARLAASGATNRDIGHELFVSPRTVEAHLTTVFRKLGVGNRRELAARAVEDERLRR